MPNRGISGGLLQKAAADPIVMNVDGSMELPCTETECNPILSCFIPARGTGRSEEYF